MHQRAVGGGEERLGSQALDLLTGLPTLRAFGRERGQAARIRDVGDAYRIFSSKLDDCVKVVMKPTRGVA